MVPVATMRLRQLGHSSIQITVDVYHHAIEEAERTQTLEVDRMDETGAGVGIGGNGHST